MNKIIAYTLSFLMAEPMINANEQINIIPNNVDTRIVCSMTKTGTGARDEQLGNCIRKGKCKD